MENNININNISGYIDHTNVKPDATTLDIKKLCREAIEYAFHSVCVTPFRVKDAKEYLGKNSQVAIICVVGFPFGFTKTKEKILEAKIAIREGATEIDMVVNIGAIKDGKWQFIQQEINQIVKAIKPVSLKVIMEVGFLSSKELKKACQLAKSAGAAFVKTATGYGPRGATIADIRLMRETVGPNMGVKASGGIHNFQTALAMIKAGATRIGTSSSLQVIGAKPTVKKTHNLSNE